MASDGSCTVSVDVTATTQGTLTNTIPPGGLTATIGSDPVVNLTNEEEATAGLNINTILPPNVTKNFAQNTIWVGQSTRLTIRIYNTDLSATMTEVGLTDTLPGTIILANPVSPTLTGCGTGTLIANVGENTVSLSNASILPGGDCAIRVYVTSPTQGIYTNDIPIGAISSKQGVTNASPASSDLNIQSVGLAKAFSPTPINAGETSTLTITLQNPTSSDYTGVALTDVLPATPNTNLQIVGGTAQTTCTTGGSPATLTVTPPRTIVLTGGTIPSGTIVTPGTCTITVNVTTPDSSTSAIYTNTIALGAMTANGGISNILSASANLEVRALSVGTAKGFSPNRFQEGGTTTVTITLSNPTSSAFTGVTFTDLFPPNIIPQSASTTCGTGVATYNNTTLPHSVSLTGGTVPARVGLTPGTCTITATATGSVVGTYTNTIPANIVTTDQGITNLTSSSGAVTVYATDQGITATKAFSPTSISAGSNSRLRITINAPADEALTGFSITDNLPLNLTISNSTRTYFLRRMRIGNIDCCNRRKYDHPEQSNNSCRGAMPD